MAVVDLGNRPYEFLKSFPLHAERHCGSQGTALAGEHTVQFLAVLLITDTEWKEEQEKYTLGF